MAAECKSVWVFELMRMYSSHAHDFFAFFGLMSQAHGV